MVSQSYEFSILQNAPVGEITELPKAGTPLEHPLVYDNAARELKALIPKGLLAVVDETVNPNDLITAFTFRRLS